MVCCYDLTLLEDNTKDYYGVIMTDAAVKDTFISVDMEDNKNIFTTYPTEVDCHASFLSAFDDEVMGAEHAFLGHDCEKDLVGGHLGFGPYDLQKSYSFGNISSALEDDEIINDAVDSTLNVEEEAGREFFDGMLQGVGERMLDNHRVLPHTTGEHPLETRTSSHEKGHGEGLLVKGKRPHKPPRRLIEESLEPKCRASSGKRCGTNRKSSEIKLLCVKSPKQALKQLSHKGNEAMLSVHEEESFSGACIQVPFGLPVEEEPVKETRSSLALSIVSCHDSDNCLSNQSTISNERSDAECLSVSAKLQEDISRTVQEVRVSVQEGKRRRNHHIPWTQSEVMKLIGGISQLGVGRWSKIKKLLFSNSKHRTSVDLKDKWRNLVKASCMQLRNKRKGLHGQKRLTHQAPEPVLRRVRDLAKSCS